MIAILLFLLACLSVYVGAIDTAFVALMRLPLRLDAERHSWLDRLGYLEDPARLFLPVRLLIAILFVVISVVVVLATGARGVVSVALGTMGAALFVLLFGLLAPLAIVRRDPVRTLKLLLPSFQVVICVIGPLINPLLALLQGTRVRVDPQSSGNVYGTTNFSNNSTRPDERTSIEEQEEHALLQSVVDFGDTLVREVMTPRPDMVAVPSDATLKELRAVFSEEQYSRLPVFEQSLDTVIGFVFIKDLVTLPDIPESTRVVDRLLRPAHVVAETKRVAELLKDLQRERVQSAIVHDEFGGTSGVVTIEDLVEELVGEIRDEYDVETESIIDEGDGSFVFSGRVSIDDVSRRLNVAIEPRGFETIAGYILAHLGRVPTVGESFEVDEFRIEVLEAERRRVQRVRIRRRDGVEMDVGL